MIKLTFWVLVKDIWGAWRCFGHSWNNFTGLYSLYFLNIMTWYHSLCKKNGVIFVIYFRYLSIKVQGNFMMRFELKDTSEQHVFSGVFSIQKVKYLAQIFLTIYKKIKVHYKDIIKNNQEYYITKFSWVFFCSLKKSSLVFFY